MKLNDPIELLLDEKGRDVHSVSAEATVFEALQIMAREEIGALAVVEDGKLRGIFTERDYARRVVLAGRSSREMRVREIMVSAVQTVEPSSTVDECMQRMTDKRCRHLPVMEGERLVGIVSIGDLVHWIIRAQRRTIHHLEDYISGDYPQ